MEKNILIKWFPFLWILIFLLYGMNDRSGERALILFPDGKEISAEIAQSEKERKRGLMFRENLADDEGMLFIFEEDDFHPFWMKNCRMPLDIIWMDARKKIVHIQWSAQPCPDHRNCPVILPDRRSRYVLEVKAGVASHSRLKIGDEIIIVLMRKKQLTHGDKNADH